MKWPLWQGKTLPRAGEQQKACTCMLKVEQQGQAAMNCSLIIGFQQFQLTAVESLCDLRELSFIAQCEIRPFFCFSVYFLHVELRCSHCHHSGMELQTKRSAAAMAVHVDSFAAPTDLHLQGLFHDLKHMLCEGSKKGWSIMSL
jgi:hypothetical protein